VGAETQNHGFETETLKLDDGDKHLLAWRSGACDLDHDSQNVPR